ncbi:MAG TPA: Na+/H+ antiporter subunit D [Euzebyales bacterium]|nr:Na+/H+ antiporter subunit D [Euzebyales bacterium]
MLALPVALPLTAAAVVLLLSRWRWAQRGINLVTCAVTLGVAIAILVEADAHDAVVTQIGGWPAPFGITLIADRFSAIMLLISAIMILIVLVYALGQLDEEREIRLHFHPVYLVLSAGVSASFLTGDLFNLFVAFEVMLIASYVLITLGAKVRQIRPGMTYVVINLLASVLFVAAVAFVYAATGTVNMAQLAVRIVELPDGLRLALGYLLLVVFGVKAGIFPLFFWLPDSYPAAPAPITALFAGLLTKVGVYTLIRTQTLLFPHGGTPSTVILVIAALTMLVGVLGAIAQNDIKRILSFHIVSQIGYMVFGLGLFTLAGLAGAVYYIVHHIVVKTSLFLVGGMVETSVGSGALRDLGGIARRAPVLGLLFLVAAFSLAGLPPFSGFVAKLVLVQEGLNTNSGGIVAVSLLVSLLTLFSMTKIWGGAFWGHPEGPDGRASEARRSPRLRLHPLMLGATTVRVGLSVTVSVAAGPLYELSERAARTLVEREAYIDAVLPTGELASHG